MAVDGNEEAARVTNYLAKTMHNAHRGAVAWRHDIVIVFGNRGNLEVPILRQVLKSSQHLASEIGFAEIEDGHCWAMLLQTRAQEAGKQAVELNDFIWECAFGPEATWDERAMTRCQVQKPIANNAIKKLGSGVEWPERETGPQTHDKDN